MKKNPGRFRLLIFMLVVFYSIAVSFRLLFHQIFRLINFAFIGTAIGFGIGLWPVLPREKRHIARRLSQVLVGGYLLFGLGFGFVYLAWGRLRPENMQLSGFWFLFTGGFFMAAVMHLTIARIVGPFLFNRAWCGWACRTAAVLDFLPWRRSPGRLPKSAGLIRLFLFAAVTAGVLILVLAFGYNQDSVSGYVAVTAFLKAGSRFSLLKIKGDKGACTDCGACDKARAKGLLKVSAGGQRSLVFIRLITRHVSEFLNSWTTFSFTAKYDIPLSVLIMYNIDRKGMKPMMELPEANTLARQINNTVAGRKIKSVIAAHSPHKLAWYSGDPEEYEGRLRGKTVGEALARGGQVEITVGDHSLLFSDGVNLRFHDRGEKLPLKHQLLVVFQDGSALSGSVQMYGGLSCVKPARYDNKYYFLAKTKPSPLTPEFDERYFTGLSDALESRRLSLKAFLATEQRIPGLGNGVLQDILFNARLHPKRKVESLAGADRKKLFRAVKATLKEMTDKGGRDTEKNLLGEPGGYRTILCSLTVNDPCPVCGGSIEKLAYLGGSVYVCPRCQRLE